MTVCDVSLIIDYCDKMCDPLAATEPGKNATVEVMLRKEEMNLQVNQ